MGVREAYLVEPGEGIVIAGGIAGDHPCGDSRQPAQQGVSGGEVLAVTLALLEEEKVQGILAGRQRGDVQGVTVFALEEILDGQGPVVGAGVPGNDLLAQAQHPLRELGHLEIGLEVFSCDLNVDDGHQLFQDDDVRHHAVDHALGEGKGALEAGAVLVDIIGGKIYQGGAVGGEDYIGLLSLYIEGLDVPAARQVHALVALPDVERLFQGVEQLGLLLRCQPGVAVVILKRHAAPVGRLRGPYLHHRKVYQVAPDAKVQKGTEAEIGLGIKIQGAFGGPEGQARISGIGELISLGGIEGTAQREGQGAQEGSRHARHESAEGQAQTAYGNDQKDQDDCQSSGGWAGRIGSIRSGREALKPRPLREIKGGKSGGEPDQDEPGERGAEGEGAREAQKDKGAHQGEHQVPAARQVEAVQHLYPDEELGQRKAGVIGIHIDLPEKGSQDGEGEEGDGRLQDDVTLVPAPPTQI